MHDSRRNGPSLSRRRFAAGLAAVATATVASPAFARARRLAAAETIIGEGEHRFRVKHHFPQLPDPFTWQTTHGVALDEDDYEIDLDAIPGEVTLSKGVGKKVVVEYWGGVEPGEQVCPMLRSALLAYVDHAFNYRGIIATDGDVELPQAFETLLAASSWNGGW